MKALTGLIQNALLASSMGLTCLLAACGGGGGGGAPAGTPAAPVQAQATIVTGTVATGKPVANAQVVLTDSNGASKSTQSDPAGVYSIDVTAMTVPFVLTAKGASSLEMVTPVDTVTASATNVVNITPWTTVLAALLSSTGNARDLDAVKDKSTIVSSLKKYIDYTMGILAPTLQDAGYSADADPVHTPFVADGTGYDSIYANTLFGQTSKLTLFIAPRCLTSNGCPVYSDPGDQTASLPNDCGHDIASLAANPCDPSVPVTSLPSIPLPVLGPNDAAGGIAISGGVHFGPSDMPQQGGLRIPVMACAAGQRCIIGGTVRPTPVVPTPVVPTPVVPTPVAPTPVAPTPVIPTPPPPVVPPPTPAPGPAPKICKGTFTLQVDLRSYGCANPYWTFNDSLELDALSFDQGPINGTLKVDGVTSEFAGAPGTCTPVNLGPAQGNFIGAQNLGSIGSGTVNVLGEALSVTYSVGSLSTVLGTIAGDGMAGRFSCVITTAP